MQEVKKIVAIGPESTGKSTLCSQLANHFKTVWCPEYAREYLLKNGTRYTFDNLLTIANGQLHLEKEYCQKALDQWKSQGATTSPLLFADTDMYVMKVWCEFVFGKVHPQIMKEISQSRCDLYLLCNVDLPWVKDELREYPDLQTREELYNIYRNILMGQNVPWVTISGTYEERFSMAVNAVDRLLI